MSTLDPVKLGQRIQQGLTSRGYPRRTIDSWVQDVGEGWRPLVRALDVQLRDLDPDYQIGQIKEKFGGLRYYIDTFAEDHLQKAQELIRAAETSSFTICEDCGGPGDCKAVDGRVRTLCPICRSTRVAQKKIAECAVD